MATIGTIPRVRKSYRVSKCVESFYSGGALALSPDGATLAAANGDATSLVTMQSGEVAKTLHGDTEPVTALCWDTASRTLWVASRSLTVKRYEASSSTELRSWKPHPQPVAAMAVDASGCLLVTGSADRSARVWDVQQGHCTHAFRGHKGVVLAAVFHPDARRLVLYTGTDEGEVRAWDLAKRAPLASMRAHFSAVTCLRVSACGSLLLSAGRDKVVTAWSTATNKKTGTVAVHEAVEGMVLLPRDAAVAASLPALPKGSGKAGVPVVYFATAGEAGMVKIWRSDTGNLVAQLPVHAEAMELELVLGGRELLCATLDARVLTLRASPADAKLGIHTHRIGNHDNVLDVHFAGAESSLVAVVSNSDAVRVHDSTTLECVGFLRGHADMVLASSAGCLPSGRALLATASKDRCLRVWDPHTQRCLAVGEGHLEAVTAVALGRKGAPFVVTGGADKLLKVWDLTKVNLNTDSEDVVHLTTSAAVAAHEKDINHIAVAPNDQLICTASQDRTARLWDPKNLVQVGVLKGHKRGVWQAQFSPVEQVVATASGDKTIRVWSLKDASCLRTLEGHTAAVLAVAFSSAGTQVLSTGSDATLKLWSLKSSECLNTFDNHEDKVWGLAVRDDGATVITGGADARLVMWEDNTAAETEAAALATEEQLLKQQDLDNALHKLDFAKAVELALELQQPHRLRTTLAQLIAHDQARDATLHTLIKAMDNDRLKTLLEYLREWNTNTKHCQISAAVLAALLIAVPATRIIKLPNIRDLLEGIQAYNIRHFNRIERLNRSTFLLDFTLASMPGGLQAEVAEENEQTTMGKQAGPAEGINRKVNWDARKRKICEGAVPPLSSKLVSQGQRSSERGFKSGKRKTGMDNSDA